MDGKNATRPGVSPTRTKATWKPGIDDKPVPFFRCATCGSVVTGIDGACPARLEGAARRPEAVLPYQANDFSPSCCGEPMERLRPTPTDADSPLRLSYDVVGGFDMNALRAFWESDNKTTPHWVALKTFTGLQLKYVLPGKKTPLVFALGDEDAYAYCDESPCLACTFHCKRGFELYAYSEESGLVSLPVHREALTSSTAASGK